MSEGFVDALKEMTKMLDDDALAGARRVIGEEIGRRRSAAALVYNRFLAENGLSSQYIPRAMGLGVVAITALIMSIFYGIRVEPNDVSSPAARLVSLVSLAVSGAFFCFFHLYMKRAKGIIERFRNEHPAEAKTLGWSE